jgi:hypothetical protein
VSAVDRKLPAAFVFLDDFAALQVVERALYSIVASPLPAFLFSKIVASNWPSILCLAYCLFAWRGGVFAPRDASGSHGI